MKTRILIFLFTVFSLSVSAQPAEKLVKVTVTPNSADWNYKPGDKAVFDVRVTMNNVLLKDVAVEYELSYDMMPAFEKKKENLKDGTMKIQAGTMKVPGFLRCRVFATHEGSRYEGLATAGFSPEDIKPTTEMPADFVDFWENAKAENAKMPMDARLKLLPERSTEKANVYELNLQNHRGSRVYGILCVPNTRGKYPAKLKVPGAGVRPYNGDAREAEQGVITLEIGIHGVPVTMEKVVYDNLAAGALSGYAFNNWDNRESVYYKRVYLGCVRAIDYLFSMDKFDGKNLVVQGGSQGGALAIITASLDKRVTGLVSFYPALSDLTGYLHNRAGGWPHLFRNTKDDPAVLKKKVETAAYYDVVNFARNLTVPGFYSFGYNDMVCAPTSTFSAYNVITAPKTLFLVPETAHYTFPEQWRKANEYANSVLHK